MLKNRLMSVPESKEIDDFINGLCTGLRKFGLKRLKKALKIAVNPKESCVYQKNVIHFIINLVCEEYGITTTEITQNKRGVSKIARKQALILCSENILISDDKLKDFFNIKTRQVIHYIRKDFEKMDRENKTDQKLFFSTYDKLNKQVATYIKTNK